MSGYSTYNRDVHTNCFATAPAAFSAHLATDKIKSKSLHQHADRSFINAMAKPGRKIKKANHGKRPASSKARKQKRREIKT